MGGRRATGHIVVASGDLTLGLQEKHPFGEAWAQFHGEPRLASRCGAWSGPRKASRRASCEALQLGIVGVALRDEVLDGRDQLFDRLVGAAFDLLLGSSAKNRPT